MKMKYLLTLAALVAAPALYCTEKENPFATNDPEIAATLGLDQTSGSLLVAPPPPPSSEQASFQRLGRDVALPMPTEPVSMELSEQPTAEQLTNEIVALTKRYLALAREKLLDEEMTRKYLDMRDALIAARDDVDELEVVRDDIIGEIERLEKAGQPSLEQVAEELGEGEEPPGESVLMPVLPTKPATAARDVGALNVQFKRALQNKDWKTAEAIIPLMAKKPALQKTMMKQLAAAKKGAVIPLHKPSKYAKPTAAAKGTGARAPYLYKLDESALRREKAKLEKELEAIEERHKTRLEAAGQAYKKAHPRATEEELLRYLWGQGAAAQQALLMIARIAIADLLLEGLGRSQAQQLEQELARVQKVEQFKSLGDRIKTTKEKMEKREVSASVLDEPSAEVEADTPQEWRSDWGDIGQQVVPAETPTVTSTPATLTEQPSGEVPPAEGPPPLEQSGSQEELGAGLEDL